MKKYILWFSVVFYVIGITNLVFFYTGITIGKYITLACLMPMLAWYYFSECDNPKEKRNVLILLSVLFAWFGDLTMMFLPVCPAMLIPGLLSFLVTHIMYVFIFSTGSWKDMLKPVKLLPAILFLAYGVVLYSTIYNSPKLETGMRIPVFIYTLAIVSGIIASLSRYGKVNRKSFFLVFAGVLLFLVSDSCLAINRFVHPFFWHYLPTMAPYFTGQFLIVIGLAEEK